MRENELDRSFRGPHPTPRSVRFHAERARSLALSGQIQAGFQALARVVERAIHFHDQAAASALQEAVSTWEDKSGLREVYAKAFLFGSAANRGRKFRRLVEGS